MKLIEQRLASLIIQSHFGPVVSSVFAALVTRGPLQLAQITRHAEISVQRVKESLFILIHHSLISHATAEEKTVYRAERENVFLRLLYPHILSTVEKIYSQETVSSVSLILVHGRVPIEDIESQTREKLMQDQLIKVEEPEEGKKFIRIDFNNFLALFRQSLVSDYFMFKYNDTLAKVVKAILSLSQKKPTVSAAEILGQLPPSLIDQIKVEGTRTSESQRMDLREYEARQSTAIDEFLLVIRNDSSQILSKTPTNNYELNKKNCSLLVQRQLVSKFILEREGRTGLRIYNILDNTLLDERLVCKYAMVSIKDARATITNLLRLGLIKLQEIPRTLDHTPSRTFFMFKAETPLASKVVQRFALHSALNLIEKLNEEKETNAVIISKTQRHDVINNPSLLHESERKHLGVLSKRFDLLETMVMNCIHLYFMAM